MSLPKDIIGPQQEVTWRTPVRRMHAAWVRSRVRKIGEARPNTPVIGYTALSPIGIEQVLFVAVPGLSLSHVSEETATSASSRTRVAEGGREDYLMMDKFPSGLSVGAHVIDYNGGYRNKKNGGSTTIAAAVRVPARPQPQVPDQT